MAAVLACGPGAALSHHSAAKHLGLIDSSRSRIDVTVPSRAGRKRRKGIQIHRSSTLRPTDVTIVDGIPTTTVARTLFDLAEVSAQRRLERALDQAEIEEVLDVVALFEQIEHNAARVRAAAALGRVLVRHIAGSTATDTKIGERLLAASRRAGLPDPEVQPWLDLQDGGPPIKPDFLWRAQRLIVETDGFKFHRGRAAFERDRRRDQRATAAGFRPLRVTWRQLEDAPTLEALLRRLVAGAGLGSDEAGVGSDGAEVASSTAPAR